MDPPVAAGEAGDDVPRPVGGVVVDDDHVGVGVQGEQGGEQGADVLPLVVRGDRDEERAGCGHVQQWLREEGLTLLKKPQDAFIGILLDDVEERPGAQAARGEEAGGVEGRDRRGGVGEVMNARLEPSGKKPPKRRRPAPRSSMKTNDAISASGVAPSTSVARRVSSGRGAGSSHGSRNWAKLRGV